MILKNLPLGRFKKFVKTIKYSYKKILKTMKNKILKV